MKVHVEGTLENRVGRNPLNIVLVGKYTGWQLQAGPFGETSLGVGIPDGLLLDEAGQSIRHAEFAPSDLLAVSVGLAAATLDIAAGHRNFTFNNLLACLICCDILQVPLSCLPQPYLSHHTCFSPIVTLQVAKMTCRSYSTWPVAAIYH